MAIYHFSGTIIARSQGRSAVACAAYRSGEKLVDERYQCERDYTNKKDVAYTEILVPEGAPVWMQDREKLWNTVERIEKRKDAQLAREFNFALPRELTLPQNIALAREFVQTVFVEKGMVADLAVHTDKAKDGELQPHAHVMLTFREVTAEGFGLKVRDWNRKDFLLEKRADWSGIVNRHLALYDHDMRIDHRSYADQKIELEPQHKIGSAEAQDKQARLEDHQRIARENGEAILKDPEIALHAMTQQQSTFTTRQVACFVHRHTVDRAQYEAVYQKVMASPALVRVGLDEQGRERFTSKELLGIETQLLKQAEDLSQSITHPVTEKAKAAALKARPLTDQQHEAFEALVEDNGLTNMVGYAGTGKSYLLGAAKAAWEGSGYQVVGATLSGIAAQGLEGGSGILTRTVASRLHYWNKGEQGLTAKTVLVVDEAGMLGSRQMGRLVAEAHQAGAKLVLVGDFEQLQAIEAGAAFRGIVEHSGPVELTEIRRQTEPWQKAATQAFARGETEQGLAAYHAHTHVHEFVTQAAAQEGLIALWQDVRHSQPDTSQIILAYTREETRQLNTLAREQLEKEGELGVSQAIQTERGERLFASGDRVYFLKNDRGLGVMNGSLGTVENVSPHQLTVRLDGKTALQPDTRTVVVDVGNYPYLEHGYAATVHKAQGVTVDRSYLLASPYLDRHATYVALSRHRQSADVFWSREQFKQEKDFFRTLSRERSKDFSLDYGQEPFNIQQDSDTASAQQPFEKTVDSAIDAALKSFDAEFAREYPHLAAVLAEKGIDHDDHHKTKDFFVSTECILKKEQDASPAVAALAQQQLRFDQVYKEALRGLAEQLGKPVSSQWQVGGEQGVYCRNVDIGGAIFCLFEQSEGFKVLPERDSHGHWPGRASTIALMKEGEDYRFVATALELPGKELGALGHRHELPHKKELGKTLEPDLEMEL